MDEKAKDPIVQLNDLFLDYIILKEVSDGNYTRKEVFKALDLPNISYLDSLLVCQYITAEKGRLKLTQRGQERCMAFTKLIERLYPNYA